MKSSEKLPLITLTWAIYGHVVDCPLAAFASIGKISHHGRHGGTERSKSECGRRKADLRAGATVWPGTLWVQQWTKARTGEVNDER